MSESVASEKGGIYLLSNGLQGHLAKREVMCKCGCGQAVITQELVDSFEIYRQRINAAINITPQGGCVCPNYLGTRESTSAHAIVVDDFIVIKACCALDIYANVPLETMFFEAAYIFAGVGLYKSTSIRDFYYLHIDLKTDRKILPLFWYRDLKNPGEPNRYIYFADDKKCFKAFIENVLKKGGEYESEKVFNS